MQRNTLAHLLQLGKTILMSDGSFLSLPRRTRGSASAKTLMEVEAGNGAGLRLTDALHSVLSSRHFFSILPALHSTSPLSVRLCH